MFRGPDRLFRRYQKTGEPRLLGAVFDRTAGELLRVATHLTRDRHRAEDLLQTTFLTAIEKARQYDPARPLLPWLLAILANHAREWHRRERRPLPVQIAPSAGGDVGDTAALSELAGVCERAIEALPEPYRPVLLLHLRHGLSGQEIGTTLGRPDSTVRNQIARGLDLLRRKLPSGIATAVVVGAVHGRGLAAVRSEVLARVPVPVGGAAALASATGVSLFGVLLMSKKVVASLVVLALVVGGSWYSGVFADEGNTPSPDAASRVASAEVAERVTLAVPVPAPAPVHREAVNPSPVDAKVGSLHATVVVGEGGTAVADAPCSVWALIENAPRRLVAERVTQADGMATVEALAPGDYVFELDVSQHEAAFTIRAGSVAEVRCEIARGFRIAGTVVDADGQPVGGAEVRCERDWFSVLLARTAADGSFAVEHLRGACDLWAVGSGRQPARRQHFDMQRDTSDLRLVLGGAGTRLSGRVVDEQGQPAANVRVYIGLDSQAGSPFLQFVRHDHRADAAGRFVVDWCKPGHVYVAAIPNDGNLDRATLHALVVEDGVPTQVLLQLGDSGSVSGTVRGEDGQPVAGAHISSSYHPLGTTPLGRNDAKSHADGTYVLRGLLPGRHGLNAERGGIRVKTTIELGRGQQLGWNPVLGEGAPIAIRLLGPADEPLKGHRLEVDGGGWTKDSGFTDHEGRSRFEHMPLVEHTVRVHGEEYGVIVAERTVMPGPAEAILRIDAPRLPSARLSGRIVDARGKPVVDCQLLLYANGSGRPQHVERDGRFKTDLLPPGHYSLYAQGRVAGLGTAGTAATLAANQDRDVGDLVLPETASLAIRLRAADGSKMRDAVLRLGNPGDVHPGSEDIAPDEVDGVHRKSGIDPGTYVLRFLAPGAAPQHVPITLTAGERRELDFIAERAVPVSFEFRFRLDRPKDIGLVNARLSVTDAAGVRVVFHRLFGYFDDHPQRIKRLRFGLLAGTYLLHLDEHDGKKKDVEIVVPAAAPADPFVIDLR